MFYWWLIWFYAINRYQQLLWSLMLFRRPLKASKIFGVRGVLWYGPSLKISHSEEYFHHLQFSSHLFSCSFLYFLFSYPRTSFAMYFLGSSLLNSPFSSICSCCLTSSASSPYSFSNSSTSSFTFPKFFLLSHMSVFTIYPFYHTCHEPPWTGLLTSGVSGCHQLMAVGDQQ